MKNFAATLINTISTGDDDSYLIDKALETVRAHLGMEIAYLTEFVDGDSVFRQVSAPGLENVLKPGDKISLQEVYCMHILEGRLPEMMPDTSDFPLAMSMPVTSDLPVGSHVSIPIKRRDGSAYGSFCCLSTKPNRSLNQRDLETMRLFADLVSHQVNKRLQISSELEEKRARIANVIDTGDFTLVYQPIWDFSQPDPVGFETLCRFSGQPYRTPDLWFNDAAETGLGVELELAVVKKALEAFHSLPLTGSLSFNLSPNAITSDRLPDLLSEWPLDRIVLEITEHSQVADYDLLCSSLARLRASGVKLAVDDAGAGYASLRHIIKLAPDIIKLDMTLTRDVNTDKARRSLATALIFFARETGTSLVAEGIETQGELDTLKLLGVHKGQGYLLGRPMDLEKACALLTPEEISLSVNGFAASGNV